MTPSSRTSPGEPFRLLFVCTGNTCRSPLAEALTRRALKDRGWEGVEVRSAGVAAAPGGRASEGSLEMARKHGVPLEEHRSVPLSAEMVEWADLILTMSPSHLGGVAMAGGGERVAVITEFAAGQEAREADPREAARIAGGVPDPFGGDQEAYEATYRALEELVEKVLDRLEPVVAP